MKIRIKMKPATFRFLPFALFMAFIGLDELIRTLMTHGFIRLEAVNLYYLYPVKAVTVGYLIFRYRKEYQELDFKELLRIPTTLAVTCVGLLVFILWINMEWTIGSSATPQGFNPMLLPEGTIRNTMILFRIAGAVLVVPIMEELFWRSFLIRYIIDNNFERIQIGTFTWGSFLLTVALFGAEHNFICAGMMAGVAYNLILYKTRSLAQCVLAHAVTNLVLAVYVACTGQWQFW
ncbi:MAG: CAAX prenyl protease-related protein [Geobacter sp.]|nr:CAAX prenyl protease-related protein [Geobacter sp.]